MKENIREYARIGLTHHLLYADTLNDPQEHARTLIDFCHRDDIETLDCAVPYGDDLRAQVIPALRDCGKEVVCTMHLFPLRKISLGSPYTSEQSLTRLVQEDQVKVVGACGALAYIFGAGIDGPENERDEWKRCMADFCRWISGELKPHGVTALLEPFDRFFDKKFLYGSSEECVELVEEVHKTNDNFALELDMAHVPQMGESFEHAIKTCAPYTFRVHLGNCVTKDPSHRFYGDQHPPIGIEGGDIDVPELTEILGLLIGTGYLNREKRGSLVFEMQPYPGRSVEDTVSDQFDRLERAWARV